MSRSLLTRVVTSAAAILVAVTAIAAPAPERARVHSLVGTLQKVDGQTLTIQTATGAETVTLAPAATVRLGSKTANVSELSAQTGARVKVRYADNAGQKQAQSVTVSTAKPVAQAARADTKTSSKPTSKK